MSLDIVIKHTTNSFISLWSLKYAPHIFELFVLFINYIGYWCPYHHECQDCARIGRPNPWYPCLHVNFNVRLTDVYLFPLTSPFPFSDKAGRSVPAPGRGALTVAREIQSKYPLPILDVAYRSRQMTFRRNQISEWLLHEHNQLQVEIVYRKAQGESVDEEYISSRIADLETEASRQEKHALAMYGMLEGSDPRIAPLRRALAVWGLTADDIGVLSIHGTSTAANVRDVSLHIVVLFNYRYRRKTKLVSGTISSPPSPEALVTLSLSLLRKASSVIRKEGLPPGKWLACYRVSSLVLFLETATASMSNS